MRKLIHAYPLLSGRGSLANARWVEWLAGSLEGEAWVRGPTRYELLAPLSDYVGRAIYFAGDLDPKVTWACRTFARAGDTVLDVGANLGLVSLTLADVVGPSGVVHAFEPNPAVRRRLAQAVARNGLSNVQLHDVALGASVASLELFVPDANAGAASLVPHGTPRRGQRVTVQVVPLAEHLGAACGPVSFMKIDVEGFEYEVLAGARELLRRRPVDTILFESNRGAENRDRVVELLQSHGYELFGIPRCYVRMRLTRFDPADPRTDAHELVAVHRDAKARTGVERFVR